MIRSRLLLTLAILCLWVGASARDTQLAGIHLDMTRDEVVALLGTPEGKMKPLPPINEMLVDPLTIISPKVPDDNSLKPVGKIPEVPNTMMFTNRLKGNEATLIGQSTIVSAGAGGGDAAALAAGGAAPLSNAPMPTDSGTEAPARVELPAWAYYVRALYLNLDQEQFIYKINETYSIGVTLTKKGNVPIVTDIVVSSFEPLRANWANGKPQYINSSAKSKRPGAQSKRLDFSAKTSTGIRIGSRLSDVLRNQKWTQYCYPFVAAKLGKITGSSNVDVPIPDVVAFVRSGFIDTVTPEPDFHDSPASVYGKVPTHISDGASYLVSAGFSRNCLMLYPEEKLAFTLIDHKVVRIQIGEGVIAPPPPPKPPVLRMPTPVVPTEDPGAAQPTPGVPGGGVPPLPPVGGGGDVWF